MKLLLIFACAPLFFLCLSAQIAAQENTEQQSPWLLAPTFSSDPKLGNTLGVLGAYLYDFDELSPSSTFGVTGSYSDSDSIVYGAFAKMYFDEDQQRIFFGLGGANINNEYNDFLGSGWPLQSSDNLRGVFLRYTHSWAENWYAGALATSSNYSITGDSASAEGILNIIGLTGFDSNGIGFIVERDTRDNQNSPQQGSLINIQNIAYRKGLGGDSTFDVYNLKYLAFAQLFRNHVTALHFDGRWTHNAPKGGYSSIQLRGYTRGEYLAPNSTSFEVEQRIPVKGKIGATVFAGVSTLYDKISDMEDGSNWFPSAGIGVNYMLKTEQKMIIRSDIAFAKAGRIAFYLQFGNAF